MHIYAGKLLQAIRIMFRRAKVQVGFASVSRQATLLTPPICEFEQCFRLAGENVGRNGHHHC